MVKFYVPTWSFFAGLVTYDKQNYDKTIQLIQLKE